MKTTKQFRVTVRGEKQSIFQDGKFVADGWENIMDAHKAMAEIRKTWETWVAQGWAVSVPEFMVEWF